MLYSYLHGRYIVVSFRVKFHGVAFYSRAFRRAIAYSQGHVDVRL